MGEGTVAIGLEGKGNQPVPLDTREARRGGVEL